MRRLATILRALWPRRVTGIGALFGVAALAVGTAALASGLNLLFLILAAMLSMLMVSGFISRLSLAGLELDCVLPEHITARRAVRARIRVGNLKRWMPSFSVHLTGQQAGASIAPLYFPVLPGNTRLEQALEVRFERRGLHQGGSFRLSTAFPFGFLVREAEVTLSTQVLVYPSVEAQAGFEELLAEVRGDLETQARGHGYDFYRIRPYEAFESARHVDWKATAHTGELQVREFAREQERLLEILLDLDAPPECEGWFEKAVECCAFLIWRLSERAARVRFRSQLFDITLPEMGDAYSVLRYLAVVTPVRGRALPPPGAEESSRLVFSARPPEQIREAGWDPARLVGPQEGLLPRSRVC